MSQDTQSSAADSPDVIACFPLSTTQQRCWFLDQMQPGNPALNVAVRWEIAGAVKASLLEKAFQTAIDRHEILRTQFAEVNGAAEQQVVKKVAFKLDEVDLRTIQADAQPARVDAIAHDFAERPFDLSRPGLIRAVLVWLAADRAIIIFVVHQSCFDGYSIRVLGHEIGTAMAAFAGGQAPELPELPLQYGDFTLWQRDYLSSGVLEEESAYWLNTLSDFGYFEVAPDKPRPHVKSTHVDLVMRDLPPEFGARLEATSKRLGVSAFTFGAAIFSAALGRMTGQTDVLFGTQIAGRLDTDLDALIGVFINNMVLRFATDPQSSIASHVVGAKSVVEGALTHQAMPFNTLVERLNPPRDPSRTPLISVNFNLQNVFMESKTYGDITFRSIPSHAPGAIYDLDLAVMGRPTGWQLNLEYAVTLFEEATAEGILDLVAESFEVAFNNLDARLAELPLPEALAGRGTGERADVTAAEAALQAHRMVADAAVVPDGAGIYGFVVPGDTGATPLESLPQRICNAVAEDSGVQLTGVSLLGGLPRTSAGAVNTVLLRIPQKRQSGTATKVDPEVLEALKVDWSDILDVPPPIASDAHFFDLGGHSVLVLRQLSKIRDRWGVSLDVTALYENAVLSDLARLVSSKLAAGTDVQAAKDWRFMTLGTKGDVQPLIAINNAATGLAMSTYGPEPRPVYCARVADADRGLVLSGQSFNDIAAAYADVVRANQPQGPYLFYGNCVHGNLALEVARTLQSDGAEIAGVVMKDVWEPAYAASILKDRRRARKEKWYTLRTRLRAVKDDEMSWGTLLRFYSIARKTGIVAISERLGLIDRGHKTDLDEEQEAFISHVSRLRDVYRPEPIDFPVLHIVTDITPTTNGFAPSIGWEKVIAEDMLETRHHDKVMVLRDKRIGVDLMANDLAVFLGEI